MADGYATDLDLDIDDYEEAHTYGEPAMCGTTQCCSEGCADPSCNI